MAEEGTTPQPDKEKDKKPEASGDAIEIRLNSYVLVDALGVTAVHNEIAFYKPDGKPLLAFNGNAYNTQTGEFQHFAVGPNHTLRVNTSEGSLEQAGMKIAVSVTLGKLDAAEVLQKLNALSEASKFINANKIEYVIVGGINYEAQNSNSVAASLVHAMGYEYPHAQLANVWAPGQNRNLLPDDWSVSEAPLDQVLSGIAPLIPDKVKEGVRNDKIPRHVPEEGLNYFPTFFKPNETTVPYVKKGEEVPLPPPPPAPEPQPTEPERELTQQEKEAKLDDDLRMDADLEAYFFINDLVANATGLDTNALDDLRANDPKKYYDIAEQEYAKIDGVLQTPARRTAKEIEAMVAEKLGVSVEELSDLPMSERDKAREELEEAGAFDYKRDNPHLRSAIEDKIKREREEIAKLEAEAAAAEAEAETEVEAEADAQKPDTAPAKPETETSSAGFKSAADTVIKTDQNLTSTFAGVSTGKPTLPAPDQGVEIKDPALTAKVAQNNAEFRAMA